MDQEIPVLQKMEETIALVKTLQQERDEAVSRSETFERENKDLKTSLATIESKLEEILALGAVSASK